jgi:hypothetical protein
VEVSTCVVGGERKGKREQKNRKSSPASPLPRWKRGSRLRNPRGDLLRTVFPSALAWAQTRNLLRLREGGAKCLGGETTASAYITTVTRKRSPVEKRLRRPALSIKVREGKGARLCAAHSPASLPFGSKPVHLTEPRLGSHSDLPSNTFVLLLALIPRPGSGRGAAFCKMQVNSYEAQISHAYTAPKMHE